MQGRTGSDKWSWTNSELLVKSDKWKEINGKELTHGDNLALRIKWGSENDTVAWQLSEDE